MYGARFVILTDHQSIKYVCDGTDLRGRKARWTEMMQDFDLDIRYRKGTLNSVADALSRIPEVNALSFTEISTDLFQSLRRLCRDDHYFGTYWQMVQDGSSIVIDQTSLTAPPLIQAAGGQWEIRNGLLFRNQKICVPDIQDLRLRIMRECHDAPTAGHPGVQRTLALVKQTFYWPKMKSFVQDYVVKCPVCQVNKAERLRTAGLLHPLAIPMHKWESISMDFITGLPRTSRGHDSIWVVVDRLTKMARFIPTRKTISATQLAHQFVEQLFRLYGLPADIVSDRDSKFTSEFWQLVFHKLETTLSLSSSDHPQSDGQTERVNQILEDMLRAYVSRKQSAWEDYLPMVEFAYNSAKHSSTGYSPFMLMYGFQPRSPVTVGYQGLTHEAARNFLQDMQETLQFARQSITSAQDRDRFYANRHRSPREFSEGTLVYLRVPKDSETLSTGRVKKLSPRYCGPFRVLRRIGQTAYKIDLPSSVRVHPVFHVSRLKEVLGGGDQIVSPQDVIAVEDLSFVPHEPDRILGFRERPLRNKTVTEYRIKWKDRIEEDSTWESLLTLRKYFPDFLRSSGVNS